ncbi:MAG: PaaI family thioesterase [Caldimicrobium sp.]
MKRSPLERVKEYIYENDRLFEFLEASILTLKEGFAEVEMEVKDKHLNAAQICQGGVIFTLADLAFALASNSYGTLALAVKANITYIKPAKVGDLLVARAEEFHRGNNLASYHVSVFKKNTEEKIAFFEGLVYLLDKPVVPG